MVNTFKLSRNTKQIIFQPVALETSDPINKSAIKLTEDLGCKISTISEGLFLFQQLLVLLQCFKAIPVNEFLCAKAATAFSAS